jgi:hypothetical protein
MCGFLHGATRPETMANGTPGRFAFFPTPEIGFAAMPALLGTLTYKGKTVAQALNIWAPPVENATNSYITNVCLGIVPADRCDRHTARDAIGPTNLPPSTFGSPCRYGLVRNMVASPRMAAVKNTYPNDVFHRCKDF